MANVTLREYIREIESLVEANHYGAALAHCLNVLESFPKNIAVHRILARILLEEKQHDSADIAFEKILAVYPDDFTSHLGLSFLAEEKGDLQKSVTHMERAFEIQPSNPEIQNELKRLYKIRDGAEPNRIRLTRGALIRMYARSNLFSQAISETNLALHEHPQRVDLELILARMLMLSNQKIEAVEKCIEIVSAYPYCFEANEILSKTLAEASEAQDVKVFRLRLIEIDPYQKFTSMDQPDVYSVPDVAISLNEIEINQISLSESKDWIAFIRKCWQDNSEALIDIDDSEADEINWDEIIEKHFNVEKPTSEDHIETSLDSLNKIDLVFTKEDSENNELIEETNIYKRDNVNTNPEWLPLENERKSIPIDNEINTSAEAESPVNQQIGDSESMPPSIWIQSTSIENSDISEPPEESLEQISPPANTLKVEFEKDENTQYYEVVLKDAHDALLSGFPQRSLECYQKLINENALINELSAQLEKDMEQFPDITPLWLVLGDAYQKMGNSEKALEIYKKAEKKFDPFAGEND